VYTNRYQPAVIKLFYTLCKTYVDGVERCAHNA
jgi:hypothetical protein